MPVNAEEKYQRNDKEHEFQYKIGKFTVLTALIVEIINVIPGTIFGNLWLCPWVYVDNFFFILSHLLPVIGLVLAICLFKGLRYVRYILAAIYAINIFRITVNLEAVLLAFFTPSAFSIIFLILTFITLIYNVIMFVSMAISKNVSTYQNFKLYK